MGTTHDRVIEAMGDRRNGPIHWRTYTGQTAITFLHQYAQAIPDAAEGAHRGAALVEQHPDTVLLVTFAAGKGP